MVDVFRGYAEYELTKIDTVYDELMGYHQHVLGVCSEGMPRCTAI